MTREQIDTLMKLIARSKIKWAHTVGAGFKGHWSLEWMPSLKTKLFCLLTTKPEKTLKGEVFHNYRISDESYINPPALVPEENFSKFDKHIKTTDPDPSELCKVFKCSTPLQSHLFILKGFLSMLSSYEDKQEIILSFISDSHSSFAKTLFVVDFNESTKAEFFKNAWTYFDDPEFSEAISVIFDMPSEKLEIFFKKIQNECQEEFMKCLSTLGDGSNESMQVPEYEESLKILNNLF